MSSNARTKMLRRYTVDLVKEFTIIETTDGLLHSDAINCFESITMEDFRNL